MTGNGSRERVCARKNDPLGSKLFEFSPRVAGWTEIKSTPPVLALDLT